MESTIANILLGLSYLLLGASVLALVAFFFKKLVEDFNSMKISLIGMGAMVAIYFIGYAAAPDAPAGLIEKLDTSVSIWSNVSAGMFTMWVLIVLTVLSMAFGFLLKSLK